MLLHLNICISIGFKIQIFFMRCKLSQPNIIMLPSLYGIIIYLFFQKYYHLAIPCLKKCYSYCIHHFPGAIIITCLSKYGTTKPIVSTIVQLTKINNKALDNVSIFDPPQALLLACPIDLIPLGEMSCAVICCHWLIK